MIYWKKRTMGQCLQHNPNMASDVDKEDCFDAATICLRGCPLSATLGEALLCKGMYQDFIKGDGIDFPLQCAREALEIAVELQHRALMRRSARLCSTLLFERRKLSESAFWMQFSINLSTDQCLSPSDPNSALHDCISRLSIHDTEGMSHREQHSRHELSALQGLLPEDWVVVTMCLNHRGNLMLSRLERSREPIAVQLDFNAGQIIESIAKIIQRSR